MKTNKMLMITGVLMFFMLTGLRQSVAAEIGIILPYSGNFNEWSITFTNEAFPYDTYAFETNSTHYNSQILGDLPPGTYTIEFNSGYFPHNGFDFGVCGDNYYSFKARNDAFTWYNAVIDASTYIQIDEGY